MKDIFSVANITEISIPCTKISYSYSRKITVDYDLYTINDKLLINQKYVSNLYIKLTKKIEMYSDEINTTNLYTHEIDRNTIFDNVKVNLNVSNPDNYVFNTDNFQLMYSHIYNGSYNVKFEKDTSFDSDTFKFNIDNEYLINKDIFEYIINYIFNYIAES